jgi:UDP-GlcNAc:undecaprenyl-phosphate GlcNAc-1-phosphate transferase
MMPKEGYIIIGVTLIVSIIIAFLITPYVIKLANKFGIVDTPCDDRRMHSHPVPLLGGISIIIAFFSTVVVMSLFVHHFNANNLPLHYILQILPGALIIAVMGFLDDKYTLPALPRLMIQCLAAGITVAMGVQITNISGSVKLLNHQILPLGYLSIPITILWIVGMTNAVNWIDGLDGLAAGICSIASFSILLIAIFQPGDPHLSVAILAAALSGGCLGLLPFNKNPAKVFMGDTGAMFLGFTLSVISIQGLIKIYATVSFAVPLLILGLPLLDTASAILRRICRGVSPTTADRSHIHHKLVDLGLSQKQAVLLLYCTSAVLSIVAVLFSIYSSAVGWRFLAAGLIIVFILFFMILMIFRRRNFRVSARAAASKIDDTPKEKETVPPDAQETETPPEPNTDEASEFSHHEGDIEPK